MPQPPDTRSTPAWAHTRPFARLHAPNEAIFRYPSLDTVRRLQPRKESAKNFTCGDSASGSGHRNKGRTSPGGGGDLSCEPELRHWYLGEYKYSVEPGRNRAHAS